MINYKYNNNNYKILRMNAIFVGVSIVVATFRHLNLKAIRIIQVIKLLVIVIVMLISER